MVGVCLVCPRGRAFCRGAPGTAGSCGEEGGAGSPHSSGEEDGQLPSGAKICQGTKCRFCSDLKSLCCTKHNQHFSFPLPCLACSVSQTILLSPDYSCSEEVLSIVSLMSVDTVLYNPPARREEVLAVRRKFTSSEGDHMTLLNIYRAFKKVGGNKVSLMKQTHVTLKNPGFTAASFFERLPLKEWCRENFVNSRNMGLVKEVQAQLREICHKVHICSPL